MSPTHHHQNHRRNSGGQHHSLAGPQDEQQAHINQAHHEGPWPCSLPQGCMYHNGSNAEHIAITKDDIRAGLEAVVKLICSNEACAQSPYMHTACFQAFEEAALACLKAQGRHKGWSDRQRLQNLWTKKGHDLVLKACECSCGQGHLRKDLEWMPETAQQQAQNGPSLPEPMSSEDLGGKIGRAHV